MMIIFILNFYSIKHVLKGNHMFLSPLFGLLVPDLALGWTWVISIICVKVRVIGQNSRSLDAET